MVFKRSQGLRQVAGAETIPTGQKKEVQNNPRTKTRTGFQASCCRDGGETRFEGVFGVSKPSNERFPGLRPGFPASSESGALGSEKVSVPDGGRTQMTPPGIEPASFSGRVERPWSFPLGQIGLGQDPPFGHVFPFVRDGGVGLVSAGRGRVLGARGEGFGLVGTVLGFRGDGFGSGGNGFELSWRRFRA